MDKVVISNEDQLKQYLNTLGINVDMFTYTPDMNDEYLMNHPWVMKDRAYYDNPNFWRTLFDRGIDPAIKFMMNDTRVNPNNLGICNSCLYTDREEAFILCERHLISLGNEEEKIIDMNGFMWILVQQNKVEKLKKMIDLAEKLQIKPMHKSWGNISYGDAILEAVKFDDDKLFNFLVQFELDTTLNESMPYCVACKYGHYAKALKLVEKGYDYKTMHNLGLKMIKRNEDYKLDLSDKDKEACKSLLKLYGEKVE